MQCEFLIQFVPMAGRPIGQLTFAVSDPQVGSGRGLKFVKLLSVTKNPGHRFFNGLGFADLVAKWSREMAVFGYARVSTEGQNLTGQLAALKAAGADPIYREKISGVRADRPQLAKLMAGLGAGDVVVVTKLDRLGRSTRELLDLIDRISKAGASFRSIGDPLWDTGSSQGRLLSTMLAAIAEFERELIRERTGEGTEARHGRRREVRPQAQALRLSTAEAIKRRAAGERLADIAKSYAVDISMISRLEA